MQAEPCCVRPAHNGVRIVARRGVRIVTKSKKRKFGGTKIRPCCMDCDKRRRKNGG